MPSALEGPAKFLSARVTLDAQISMSLALAYSVSQARSMTRLLMLLPPGARKIRLTNIHTTSSD